MARIVIKIGSNIITREFNLDYERIHSIVKEVNELIDSGHEVLIVSSGAIAAGMGRLSLKERPVEIELKQAVAAVGQSALIWAYEKAFHEYGKVVAQILLTGEDFSQRKRYINSRNTLMTLLKLRIVPVINENDTVATEEIRFGDNDNLAALVSGLIEAQRLFILSDVDGLFDKDPVLHKDARLIEIVESFSNELFRYAGSTSTKVGTGGMYSKLLAAQKASMMGVTVHIINGRKEGIISAILEGRSYGTTILAQERLPSRKGWLAYSTRVKGSIVIDDGAVNAIINNGKSLLPSGIIGVQGDFDTGDAVYCVDRKGTRIAKGLTNYSSYEIKKIKGKKSYEIESVLGYKYSDEVIHRDNMIVLRK